MMGLKMDRAEKTEEINKILTTSAGINGILDDLKEAIFTDIEKNTIVECYSSSEKV